MDVIIGWIVAVSLMLGSCSYDRARTRKHEKETLKIKKEIICDVLDKTVDSCVEIKKLYEKGEE